MAADAAALIAARSSVVAEAGAVVPPAPIGPNRSTEVAY